MGRMYEQVSFKTTVAYRKQLDPSNTMSPGPRTTSVPSGILIHPTVWPQYTNVTDRQTGQRSRSIWRTVTYNGRPPPKKNLCASPKKAVCAPALWTPLRRTWAVDAASLHCKHLGVCPFWHGALSADNGFFGAWPM